MASGEDARRGEPLDAARWERIQSIFNEAVERPPADRAAFVRAQCASDAALENAVTSMLAEDSRSESLLDRGVARVAREVLGSGVPPSLQHELFGSYRITEAVGEGGMGVVYLGKRDDLGSVAAIKILRDAWLSPARRERFAAEQRTLAQLNHPAIARLYDAGALDDGTPWIAMEYVEGVPLTEYCRQRMSPLPERLRLFKDVCEAVQHAHRHLVIHRDLKPSNILVTPDGKVKLLDFGIAKQLESVDASVDQTRTGLRLMTPAYAAPEQLRGDRVGIHTDIYSLGVVLYELLVGRLPFDLSNRTPGEAELIIIQQEPERPSAAARRTAPDGAGVRSAGVAAWADIDVLCLTGMHKDPLRRYRTVEAFVRDVDHFLRGEPLEARPDTVGYRARKFARRRWRETAAAATVFAIVVSLVTFYTLRLRSASSEAVAEAARAQRIQQFMTSLFQGGDQAVGPADSLRVVTLVDRGVREARTLDADPAVQAELYETLGTIYQQLGNFSRSDTLLRAALDQRTSRFGDRYADVASSLISLGMLRVAEAKFDDAERLIRQGLETAQRNLPAGHPVIARATAALGRVVEDRGDYAKAIPILEEAVRLHESDTTTADFRSSITELANSYFYTGQYARSDTLNRRILALDRSINGPRHPHVADDLINLGAIQFELGHFAQADTFYREALDIIERWYGPNHAETASALTMLARSLVSQKRLEEALALAVRARDIAERVYGPVHPRVASAVNEVGRVATTLGKLDEAEAAFTRMTAIYKQVYNDKHYYIGISLSNTAGVHYLRKNYARAEALFREAIRRYGDELPADHQLVGIARVRLGRVLLAERRFADAERESLAGYDIIRKQSPANPWLNTAREDLTALYDSTRQPEKSARFRAELAERAPAAAPAGNPAATKR
jgi:serine/threonine-protein kinase